MSVKENLIAAKALIDTPEKWKASSIVDAMARADESSGIDFRLMRNALYDQLLPQDQTLTGFNRDHSHADIMALFDRAIAAQEERGNG